jgi:hypothetical protein
MPENDIKPDNENIILDSIIELQKCVSQLQECMKNALTSCLQNAKDLKELDIRISYLERERNKS